MSYPIKPLSGSTTDPVDFLNDIVPSTYGTTLTLADGREFVYGYTALTTIVYGGCVAIGRTGSATTAGLNPLITLPETDDNVAHRYGISCKTMAAAGGFWVQTKGRCTHAIVDGGTDVAIGDSLKPVDGAQYLVQDAAVTNTKTAAAVAFSECVEAAAIAAQTDTTNGDADHAIYLIGESASL